MLAQSFAYSCNEDFRALLLSIAVVLGCMFSCICFANKIKNLHAVWAWAGRLTRPASRLRQPVKPGLWTHAAAPIRQARERKKPVWTERCPEDLLKPDPATFRLGALIS